MEVSHTKAANKKRSITMIKVHKDPAYNKRLRISLKKVWAVPKMREACSQRALKRWKKYRKQKKEKCLK